MGVLANETVNFTALLTFEVTGDEYCINNSLVLSIIKPDKIAGIVQKHGFVKIRQSGSHAIFKHPDGRWTSIPIHRKTIGKGLLRKILNDVKIDPEDI